MPTKDNYSKNYYLINKEKILKYQKEYYYKNPQPKKRREIKKDNYTPYERYIIYSKNYYEKNKKRIIERNIDRYNNLISGRLNPTENTFNKGIFIISFK